jgi:hypothetical protein
MNATRRFPVLFLAVAIGFLLAATGCSKKSSTPSTDTTASTSTPPATSSTTSTSSSSGKAVSGSDVLTAAQSNKSSIEAGKASGQTVTSPPQPIPQGTTNGGTNVQPPQPQGDSFLVWEFEATDLDGDDVEESGVAMIDSTNTLYVWWSDISWWSGDELDGFLWIADTNAGFILVLDDEVGLACAEAESGDEVDAGCIGCDDEGNCELIAISAVWTGSN